MAASTKLHFLFLAFPFLVFLALMYKVRAHRTLDLQKRTTQMLVQKLALQRGSDKSGQSSQSRRLSYMSSLEEICRNALRATAVAGNQPQPASLSGLTAVLFLADTSNQNFRAVTVAEGVPEYDELLRTFFPPFLKIDDVKKSYTELHLAAVKNQQKKDPAAAREAFLGSTKDSISVCGISYATNKMIAIHNTRNCLLFRSEVFSTLSPADQRKFQLSQVIALPVHAFGRRAGILLLMAAKGRRFYTNDNIYSIVSRVVGLAVEIGIDFKHFSEHFPDDFLSSNPLEEEPSSEASAAIVRMINQIRSDFSNVLDGEVESNYSIVLSNHDQGVYELRVADSAIEVIAFNAALALLHLSPRRLMRR